MFIFGHRFCFLIQQFSEYSVYFNIHKVFFMSVTFHWIFVTFNFCLQFDDAEPSKYLRIEKHCDYTNLFYNLILWLQSRFFSQLCFHFFLTVDLRGAFNKFPDFFVPAFKIVVDYWTFSTLLLDILWDDWPIFMISASKEQLQQQLEYTLLKPDCHSWWISKMQSGREDILEERYAIKFCFKFGKNALETYGMLQAGSLWGMMKGVEGVRKSIHHSWLA